MAYYAFTVPGVEGLLAREIADGGGRVSERRSGVVFFEWQGDQGALLHLGLAEDVFALVARQEVSFEKDGLRQIEALVQGAPSWERALLHQGLECRTQLGGCKLRFVCRSEDVWFSNNPPRAPAKRTRARPGGSAAKRRKLTTLMQKKLGKDAGPNALSSQPTATPAPLPSAHKLRPLPEAEAVAS